MENNQYNHGGGVRIRAARRRKRAAIEDRDKQLLRLDREHTLLDKEYRKRAWVPLEIPYQRGWERLFVLREDVKRDRRAAFYQNILDKINTRQWSHRKDFKHKKRSHGKKVYVVREQDLDSVSEYIFNSRKFTDQERTCFYSEVIQSGTLPFTVYRFAEPWRFVLRVRPNMVTHVRMLNTEIEKRQAYLQNYFERRCLWPKLHKLRHGCNRWWGSRSHRVYENPFLNKPLHVIVDEYGPLASPLQVQTPGYPGVSFFNTIALIFTRILAAQKDCAAMFYF